MTTPGFLPGTRPTAASYGQDLEDEFPVRNPKLEYSATDLNNLRHDAAFLAEVTPRARIHVKGTDGAGFTDASVVAYYGIAAANVTLARTALGQFTVVVEAGAGFTVTSAKASGIGLGTILATPAIIDPSTVAVYVYDVAGAAYVDKDFVVDLF